MNTLWCLFPVWWCGCFLSPPQWGLTDKKMFKTLQSLWTDCQRSRVWFLWQRLIIPLQRQTCGRILFPVLPLPLSDPYRKPSPSSLPLCRKVTARLIGINQLAAPVEWRRRDLKRNGIDPKREVYTAPGPALVPIHLPQHNIIIPNSTTEEEEEGASLGFLGQEQKAREVEKKLN